MKRRFNEIGVRRGGRPTIEIICMARPPRIPVMLPWECLLRTSESIREKWKYVRENPVRAGLVGYSSDWRYLGEIFALDYRVERL